MRTILWGIAGMVLVYFVISYFSGSLPPVIHFSAWFIFCAMLLIDLYILTLRQDGFKEALPYVLVVLILAGSLGFFWHWNKKFLNADGRNIYLLIEKIDAYKKKQDTYPQNLNQLVPDYLPAVPKAANGNNFIYDGSAFSYTLQYPPGEVISRPWYYDSDKGWKED